MLSKVGFSMMFFLAALFIVGCMVSTGQPGTTAAVSTQALPEGTSPTKESTPTPLDVPSPTTENTPTHTITPLSTPTATLSLSPMMIPTLSENEARLKFIDLLADNGGCRLPCLWGITPGKSSYPEAQAMLLPLSSISDLREFGPGLGSMDLVYIEGDLEFFVFIGILRNSDELYEVGLTSRAFRIGTDGKILSNAYDSVFFGKTVGYYELPRIFSEYGKPESILMFTLGNYHPDREGKEKDSPFKVILIYPEQRIIIRYSTRMVVINDHIQGCLANASMEVRLFSSGSGNLLDILGQQWKDELQYYKPVEEVTSMSLEEFYRTYRQSEDVCIDTPAKYWPTPMP